MNADGSITIKLPYERERSSLGHLPATQKWEFDESVTGCFEDMLRRSIPQYDAMRHAVTELGSRYVQFGTDIVDLGASRGDALAPFIDRFGAQNRYVAVEVSEPMLAACRERYSGLISQKLVSLLNLDLRKAYPNVRASLTLSILTLQFPPIEHRQAIVRRIFKNTAPGGALILVEKIIGGTAEFDEHQVELYYDMKRANGYTDEEITRKRLSLEGVLVPVTARWNEDLLLRGGFEAVEPFWRWMNFCAWVAVRGDK